MVQLGERHLAWKACYNVRDTGGYATHDGKQTRWRALVRADSLCQLQRSGIRALVDYDVRTIIDLRSESELARAPHPFSHPNGVTYLKILVLDETDAVGAKALRDAPSTRELNAVIVERYPTRLARVVRAFARAQVGGVLVHCQVGKDRTGLVVALLLSLPGAPEEIIAEDYALSDLCLRPVFERYLRRDEDSAERVRLAAQWPCAAESMLSTLELLRADSGGVGEYLQAAGLLPEDIERVRERLRA